MSKRNKNKIQTRVPNVPQNENSNEAMAREATEKYKELYSYSTDILLKEHERFNRADDKASKFATMFVFLIGAVAYFDKWIFDGLTWPDFPTALPPRWNLIAVGLIALLISSCGLFLAHRVLTVRPIISRPLNQEILDFFEKHPRITIYYGLARENSKAYEENKKATDQKYLILKWEFNLMLLVFISLTDLVIMYCIYSWC